MKKYHLGDILSITHDKLVSPRHMDGIYDILNYMTMDNLYTHQLPSACRITKPILHKQLPFLKDIDSSSVGWNNWKQWLDEQVSKYGEMHDVPTLYEESK